MLEASDDGLDEEECEQGEGEGDEGLEVGFLFCAEGEIADDGVDGEGGGEVEETREEREDEEDSDGVFLEGEEGQEALLRGRVVMVVGMRGEAGCGKGWFKKDESGGVVWGGEPEASGEVGAGDGARFGRAKVLDDAGAEGAGGRSDDPLTGCWREEQDRSGLTHVTDGDGEGCVTKACGQPDATGDGGHVVERISVRGGFSSGGSGEGNRRRFEAASDERNGLVEGLRGGLGSCFGCGHGGLKMWRGCLARGTKCPTFGAIFLNEGVGSSEMLHFIDPFRRTGWKTKKGFRPMGHSGRYVAPDRWGRQSGR